MRIRHKPWAKPELEACEFCVKTPDGMKGKWQEAFPKKQEIHLELGCGKGGFISQLAPENPDINFIAADIKSEMLGLAKRKLEKAYEEKGLEPDNIRIFTKNIENISQVFSSHMRQVSRVEVSFLRTHFLFKKFAHLLAFDVNGGQDDVARFKMHQLKDTFAQIGFHDVNAALH